MSHPAIIHRSFFFFLARLSASPVRFAYKRFCFHPHPPPIQLPPSLLTSPPFLCSFKFSFTSCFLSFFFLNADIFFLVSFHPQARCSQTLPPASLTADPHQATSLPFLIISIMCSECVLLAAARHLLLCPSDAAPPPPIAGMQSFSPPFHLPLPFITFLIPLSFHMLFVLVLSHPSP